MKQTVAKYVVTVSDKGRFSRFEYKDKGRARRWFDKLLASFVEWPSEAFFLIRVDEDGETVLAEKLLGESFARCYRGYHDIKETV